MSYASSSVSQHIEPRMRQLVDWSAALWAGLIAGIVFLILNLIIIPIGWDTNIWLIVGIIGGAIFGIAIFCINVYGLTYFYYWFSLMRSWPFLLAHIIFGALAGGIYEALEVEEFVVDHS